MHRINHALLAAISKSVIGRTEIQPRRGFDHLNGRRVMVTGAGGSIGSELARHIIEGKPSHLSLLELSEYNLYEVARQIRNQASTLSMSALLADIRCATVIERIFEAEKPEVVYHAAALKHVPLLEQPHNMIEAARTNILGTKNIADNCGRCGVKEMVLVSTDKAVNPTSIMGLTKRCAELYVQSMAQVETNLRFVTVRFGNVLGTSGSVVPLFIEQAMMGRPITITHPDIVRYFITLSEAVDLILRVSQMGMSRPTEATAIYTLDMGMPISIVDLARYVCEAVGKKLGEDIQLQIVGLRPGEKLIEELAYPSEAVWPTSISGINCVQPRNPSVITEDWLSRLSLYTNEHRPDQLLDLLHGLVPEYRPNERSEAA